MEKDNLGPMHKELLVTCHAQELERVMASASNEEQELKGNFRAYDVD